MLKVALTHDVDRTRKSYQYVTGVVKNAIKGKLSDAWYHLTSRFKKEPYWNMYDIAALEDSYGVRSTFFMLDESIKFNPLKPATFALAKGRYDLLEPKIQEAVRYLDANGWEIGLHGSFLSYNNKELLAKEKARLESIVGHPVYGTRQHHLNMDDTTWKIHEDLGFQYDSTWGSNYHMGWVDGKIKPFHPHNNTFTVFPLSVMDVCFMPDPKRWEKLDKLMDEAEEHDAVVVVNFHQRVYNEKEFPGHRAAYIRIIESALQRKGVVAPLNRFYEEYSAKTSAPAV
ncbi:MAG: polysaccharide deacetylase family protein [Flavobacteriales bacterium]|nr:polysaccharide deacetylase family protein [Flavobacteriales bacterium]